jgi:G3E family GTPase
LGIYLRNYREFSVGPDFSVTVFLLLLSEVEMSAAVRTRVHLVTGFLGTGKTTSILHWLQHKPAAEKWAVLVNEFGEVGVDGEILRQLGNGIAVREVPGGCLCCVSGLPFQIGLNMLLSREKPDVLLIEPTGLGHPRQILDMLRQPAYASVLQPGATITLVDPRHLTQDRYRQHEIYRDQLAVADVLLANKTDLASAADLAAFQQLLDQQQPLASARVCQGQADVALLMCLPVDTSLMDAVDGGANKPAGGKLPMLLDLGHSLSLAPGERLRRLQKDADGMSSVGWLINGSLLFSAQAVADWLGNLNCERAKAVLNTDQGGRIYNLREGVLSEVACDAVVESRLELILAMTPDTAASSGESLQAALESTLLDVC